MRILNGWELILLNPLRNTTSVHSEYTSNGKRFCRPKVNSPEMLSHVARIFSGEVYREIKVINFCKIKSFCNVSFFIYHDIMRRNEQNEDVTYLVL